MKRFSTQTFDFDQELKNGMENLTTLIAANGHLSVKEKSFANHLIQDITKAAKPFEAKSKEVLANIAKREYLPIDSRTLQNEIKKTLDKWANRLQKANSQVIKGDQHFKKELFQPVNQLSDAVCKQLFSLAFKRTERKVNQILTQSSEMPAMKKQAVRKIMSKIDEAAYDFFYGEPISSRPSAKEFKNRCAGLVKQIEPLIKDYRNAWDKMNGLFKALLGFISLITIIPALMINSLSKQGYKNTFFPPAMNKEFKDNTRKIFQYNEAPPERANIMS